MLNRKGRMSLAALAACISGGKLYMSPKIEESHWRDAGKGFLGHAVYLFKTYASVANLITHRETHSPSLAKETNQNERCRSSITWDQQWPCKCYFKHVGPELPNFFHFSKRLPWSEETNSSPHSSPLLVAAWPFLTWPDGRGLEMKKSSGSSGASSTRKGKNNKKDKKRFAFKF